MEMQESTTSVNWRTQVAAWRESGLSMNRYCQQHELAVHQLGYYKRKFQFEQDLSGRVSSGFSRVALTVGAPQPQGLTLHLANGHLISGISSRDLPLIGSLVRALS